MSTGWRNYYTTARLPLFVVNPASLQWDEGHQINWAALDDRYQEDAVIVKCVGVQAGGATAIVCTALTGPIPKGSMLYFGETGEFALLTAAAAAGATSLTVQALPQALEDGDEAYYSQNRPGKLIRAGTIMTFEGGYMIPRAMATVVTPTSIAGNIVTLNAHGVGDNEVLRVGGVTGNTGVNGVWEVEALDPNTFQLLGSLGSGAGAGTMTYLRAARGILGSNAFEGDRSAALSGRGLIIGGLIWRNVLPGAQANPTVFPTYCEELVRFGKFEFRTYLNSIA